MTVRNEIDVELWEVIQKNYDAENYTGAILDAVFKLTDTIRNKTGLEGDGASLIGQAFGGDDPRIKLNKLQTDSEKDIQRGIQEVLRGIYTGIRNPRSHDAMIDDKVSTDAIIIFIKADIVLPVTTPNGRCFCDCGTFGKEKWVLVYDSSTSG